MSSVRRSTRLSSINKTVNVTPTKRTTRNSWRQSAQFIEDTSTESEGDDNENYNILNEMKPHHNDRNRTTSKIDECELLKTPRSKRNKRKTTTNDLDHGENEQAENNEEELVHVSPPKLALLTIRTPTSKKKTHTAESETEFTPPRNKYQNARRVLSSTETQKLSGREEQLQQLRDFFQEHIDQQTSGSLYVSGQPGTGKTACLSMLLHSPEFANRLQCVYVNCTSIASVGGVYKKLCTELGLHPTGRTERDCISAIQQHLRTARRMVLIVLDEIDQLCTSKQSVLYTIFEWPALPGARLLLVGIANSLDLTDRALMRLNSRCELKPRLMHFPAYSKQQIIEIFRTRLSEAGVLDIFPPVTLQLLAAKVSAVSGDVRRALDIGRRVVEIAEQKKKAGCKQLKVQDFDVTGEGNKTKTEKEEEEEDQAAPVQVAEVAAVLNNVYGASQSLQTDIEDSFPMQQKIMLCTLLLMLRKERNKNITMARLHEVYRRVCIKRNIQTLDQTEFFGLVDLVETRGILRLMRKKEPRQSKVLLQWDEEEVNAALRDKLLIASILDDTACLGK